MTGASAIGVPGCPEFAFSTASMESVRMVSIESLSRESDIASGGPALAARFCERSRRFPNAHKLRWFRGRRQGLNSTLLAVTHAPRKGHGRETGPHPATYLNSTSILYIFC